MSTVLPTNPNLPSSTIITDLGGVRYAFTLTWHPRLRGWYFDLALEDGTALIKGRRLCPGVGPLWGVVKQGLPSVVLVCIGPSDYTRYDLGQALQVVVLSQEEVSSIFEGVTSTAPKVIGVT